MKICGLAVSDWEPWLNEDEPNRLNYWYRHTADYSLYEASYTNNSGCVRLHTMIDKQWVPNFYLGFAHLHKIYNGPKYFASRQEAQQYLDEWLTKIEGLKVFW